MRRGQIFQYLINRLYEVHPTASGDDEMFGKEDNLVLTVSLVPTSAGLCNNCEIIEYLIFFGCSNPYYLVHKLRKVATNKYGSDLEMRV